jgi:hypothetical protein
VNLLRRLPVPLLAAAILVGAGLAFILVPEHAKHESCHGSALSVVLREERPLRHSDECHDKALTDLIFGSAVGLTGFLLAPASLLLLRRPPPGAGP